MLLKMVKNALKTMIKYCQNMGLSVGGLICGGAYLMTSVSVSSDMGLSVGGLICGGGLSAELYGSFHVFLRTNTFKTNLLEGMKATIFILRVNETNMLKFVKV